MQVRSRAIGHLSHCHTVPCQRLQPALRVTSDPGTPNSEIDFESWTPGEEFACALVVNVEGNEVPKLTLSSGFSAKIAVVRFETEEKSLGSSLQISRFGRGSANACGHVGAFTCSCESASFKDQVWKIAAACIPALWVNRDSLPHFSLLVPLRL